MCYTIPLAGAITTSLLWKKKKSPRLWWLCLLFSGASLFGVVDHLWHGELLLISENWVKDLGLGAVITLAIFVSWGALARLSHPASRSEGWERLERGKVSDEK